MHACMHDFSVHGPADIHQRPRSFLMQVKVSDKLSGPDRTGAPVWGSFCGVSNGAWQGKVAAFAPRTGPASHHDLT